MLSQLNKAAKAFESFTADIEYKSAVLLLRTHIKALREKAPYKTLHFDEWLEVQKLIKKIEEKKGGIPKEIESEVIELNDALEKIELSRWKAHSKKCPITGISIAYKARDGFAEGKVFATSDNGIIMWEAEYSEGLPVRPVVGFDKLGRKIFLLTNGMKPHIELYKYDNTLLISGNAGRVFYKLNNSSLFMERLFVTSLWVFLRQHPEYAREVNRIVDSADRFRTTVANAYLN